MKKTLLNTRICDLNISIEDSYIKACLTKLEQELYSKSIMIKPKIWVSTDWFCPDGHTGFALPFFLLSKELIELEKEMIGEAEGEGKDWTMMLMRHEMGHVLDNAFYLRKKKKRQELFGKSSLPYPEKYRPDIYSRHFVRNLEDYYAQAHPDEDWAETFAVWLNPRIKWKKAYRDWPALKKLEYLNMIMEEIMLKKPIKKNYQIIENFRHDRRTLAEYYQEKIKRLRPHRKKSSHKTNFPMVMM